MEDTDDQEWEDPTARSPARTALLALGSILVAAAVALFVGQSSTTAVDPSPSPDGLTIESEEPPPTGPAGEEVTFMGIPMLAALEPPRDASYESVEIPGGTIGLQVPRPPGLLQWAEVVFTCNDRSTRLAPSRPADGMIAPQVVYAAAAQYAADRGCDPRPPEESTAAADGQTWAVPLLRMVHRAGFVVEVGESTSGRLPLTLSGPGLPPLDVVLGARSVQYDGEDVINPALPSPDGEVVSLGDGEAVEDAGRLFMQCHAESVMEIAADEPDPEAVLFNLGCRPEAPPLAPDPARATLPDISGLVDRLEAAGVEVGGIADLGAAFAITVGTVEGSTRVVARSDDPSTTHDHLSSVHDDLVAIGDGEALLRGEGELRMTCDRLYLAAGPPLDPALAAMAVIAQIEGCVPSPFPTLAAESARARRLDLIRQELALQNCCNDPTWDGGGLEAVRFQGHDLAMLVSEPERGALLGPGGRIGLADGTARRGGAPEGPEDVRFACGDSDYVVQSMDPTIDDPPVVALAEAVVALLNCTPSAER